MAELITSAQMRAIEEAAIGSGSVTGLALMERAGQGVVEAVFEEWPELAGVPQEESSAGEYLQKDERAEAFRAVVLCGPGNNGGDGFVVARLLAERGWVVEVYLFGDAGKLPADARVVYDQWLDFGGVAPLTLEAVGAGPRPSLMVDAIFGTGINRALPLEVARAHHAVAQRDADEGGLAQAPHRCVAVDCPSGWDADSGRWLLPHRPDATGAGETWAHWWDEDARYRHLRTDLNVTFHRERIGHFLHDVAPRRRVVDIGLGGEPKGICGGKMRRDPEQVVLLDFDRSGGGGQAVRLAELLSKSSRHNKFDHGHAVILSGPPGKGGAARLAARAALRIGAGLVTVACPLMAVAEHAAQLTAIMVEAVQDARDFGAMLEDERITALCIGPGLGRNEGVAAQVSQALGAGRATVLDADALSHFQGKPQALFDMLHDRCVLTPHGGEFKRLFPDIAERLNAPPERGPVYSKVDATREAAVRAGCVVLFKGPDTVIAAPDGSASINTSFYERDASWLATAGSGDVLAGFITGLLARGFAPLLAAEVAAWLHTECALQFGPGLIAEDLPEQLPAVLRALQA